MSATQGVLLARGEKSSERIEMRVGPSWVRRVEEAADRKGLKVAAYIRMVVTERMDADGIPRDQPPPTKKR